MAEKLTKAQRQKNLAKAKEHIKNNKVVTVDRDAIIDIPVLGSFRDYIQETLNYILSSHNQKDVINVLAHIQNNFQDIKEDDPYDPLLTSTWCLMTLIHEINHQAAEQGKTFATEEKFDESMSNLINSVDQDSDPEVVKELFKTALKTYKDKVPDDIKSKVDEIEKKTSNED
tara:strand:- start:698 stop:1213 length:516 start_codon:yes stop_codon:yes gene_type:complete